MLYSLGSQAAAVDINDAFHLYYNVVCGSSFSRSQPDFEGFLRALRFPPSGKLTPSLIQYIAVQCTEGLSWVNIRIIIIVHTPLVLSMSPDCFYHSLSAMDLFILCVLFSHFATRDATLGNIF